MCFISILSPVFPIKKKAIDFYSCSYRKLGKDWKIEDSVLDEIDAFTSAMYGYPRETQINCIRSKMLKKMVAEDKSLSTDSKSRPCPITTLQKFPVASCSKSELQSFLL